MGFGFIYRSPLIYEFLMRGLYGCHYADRYRAVADLIPDNASVVDLCCGPGTLFERYLRHRPIRYIGLDANPRFINRVRSLGADARLVDLTDRHPLPTADYVIIQGSLYHFLPKASEMVDRMMAAARKQVIISEPVRNLARSSNPVLSWIARIGTRTESHSDHSRFDQQSLDTLLGHYGDQVVRHFPIPGGRDSVYVLKGTLAQSC